MVKATSSQPPRFISNQAAVGGFPSLTDTGIAEVNVVLSALVRASSLVSCRIWSVCWNPRGEKRAYPISAADPIMRNRPGSRCSIFPSARNTNRCIRRDRGRLEQKCPFFTLPVNQAETGPLQRVNAKRLGMTGSDSGQQGNGADIKGRPAARDTIALF
jgi:hypothetical protein